MSLAGRAREYMKSIGKRRFTICEVSEALDLLGDKDKRPIYGVFSDMVERGEIRKVETGMYEYVGLKKKASKEEALWRLVRMRKTVTVDDLLEMSGATRSYAKECLQAWVRKGYITPAGKETYRLIKDAGVEVPKNTEKAARLKLLRDEITSAIKKIFENVKVNIKIQVEDSNTLNFPSGKWDNEKVKAFNSLSING